MNIYGFGSLLCICFLVPSYPLDRIMIRRIALMMIVATELKLEISTVYKYLQLTGRLRQVSLLF